MKSVVSILAIILSCTVYSCKRIESKGQEITDKSLKKVKNKSDELVDKVLPKFDSFSPDTRNNIKRFTDFLQVELTPDIKNIYCFSDAIGIDASYQFSFNCDSETVQRIIQKHKLTIDTTKEDLYPVHCKEFKWWDTKKIEKLPLYSIKGEHDYYQYFWYDASEKKAYYLDFDM